MELQQTDDSRDVQDLLRPIWRRRWIVAVATILATAATFFYYASQPDEYTASTSVYLRAQGLAASVFGTASSSIGSDRNTTNQAQLIQSRVIIDAAAERLKLSPEEVSSSVSAAPASGSDFLTVSGTSEDPERAAAIANTVTRMYISRRNDLQSAEVDQAIAATQEQLDQIPDTRTSDADTSDARRRNLEERLERLQTVKALPAGDISITQRANVPGAPSAPRPTRNAVFAFVLSLLAAALLAIALDRFDRRVKRLDDAGALYGLPVLGAVPHIELARESDGVIAMPPKFREPLRSLKASIRLASLDAPLKTLLVTSAIAGEGKSTVVRNLAVVYREWGLRVAVLEVDLRRPSLRRMFGLPGETGLIDVLSGTADLETALQSADIQVEGLELLANIAGGRATGESNGSATTVTTPVARDSGVQVLVAGGTPANPEAVLATERVASLIREIADNHDIVLIDAPPLLAVSDAVPLLNRVDGVLVVTRHGVTPKEAAGQVAALLARVRGMQALGVVVNDFPEGNLASGYGYYGPDQK